MYLRELKLKDAPLMLEWMHDASVVADLKANFASKTLKDCETFIAEAPADPDNIHLAIADEQDTYLGTVSLKHIHRQESWAEFAIVIRTAAMGRGISRQAMEEILRYGHETQKLEKIYWCVSTENARAVRFYDKNGYRRTDDVPSQLLDDYRNEGDVLLWYVSPV